MLLTRSRHRRCVIEPLSALEMRSLEAQHATVMASLAANQHIRHGLMVPWISVTETDLAMVSLESLADTLAQRVRALAVDVMPRCIFKLGLTRDPRWRWYDAPFSYSKAGEFSTMELLLVSQVGAIQYLEEALITRFHSQQGCWNLAPGGETPPPRSYPCYLYIVLCPVDTYMAKRLRMARRAG